MLPGVDSHSISYYRDRLIDFTLEHNKVFLTFMCICVIIAFYKYNLVLCTFLSAFAGTEQYLSVQKCLKFRDNSHLM